jgi:hypothetical protein
MILSVICSCIQNVRYPLTKLTALELLMEFGAYVDDDIALGRIVPYIGRCSTPPPHPTAWRLSLVACRLSLLAADGLS